MREIPDAPERADRFKLLGRQLMAHLRFLLNGVDVRVDDPAPTTTLLDWLREQRRMTGTKEGCNEGDCGACTVAVTTIEDGHLVHRALNACILFLPQLHGRAVRTVEGVAGPDGALHPVQHAMVEEHGSQCGFCTPGIVMSLYAAHRDGRRDWNDVLAGNLCRCTGYSPIMRAAEVISEAPPPPWDVSEREAIEELDQGEGLATASEMLPTDLDEFAEWYAANPEATLIAGATDIGLLVTKSLRHLTKPTFLHRLTGLQSLELRPDGLHIGAGVTLSRLRGAMAGRHPDFAELIRRYGSVQVRNAATVGGNIANGSPIGDCPPALIALGATITLRRGAVRRELPLENYFLGYGRQDRVSGEFIESVFVPVQTDALRCYKVSKRFDQDISAICGCFNLGIDDGIVTSARIAFGGMAATPRRALAVENVLLGRPWTQATVAAGKVAMKLDFAPITDMRASAPYRLRVAENLLERLHFETTQPCATRLVGRGAA